MCRTNILYNNVHFLKKITTISHLGWVSILGVDEIYEIHTLISSSYNLSNFLVYVSQTWLILLGMWPPDQSWETIIRVTSRLLHLRRSRYFLFSLNICSCEKKFAKIYKFKLIYLFYKNFNDILKVNNALDY